MHPDRYERVLLIFGEAVERAEIDREALVERECGDDAELLDEVRELLRADARADLVVDRPISDLEGLARAGDEPPPEAIGESIGPYRIVRLLGTGGMGRVYLAERVDGGFEQHVALKVLKRGLDTDEIVRRFEAERQILARLQHPNIARLLDGGTTEAGLPFFTLEYVDGTPIDEHCRQRRLNIAERLMLFETVCEAVQYAHGNLVVHRDLKPTNILIDAEGRVKLLDFGIAKVLESDDGADLTRTGARIMTPRYASPEQVRGEAVTIATDVYSLGVALYELLAGTRPFQGETLTPIELEQRILETPPEKPSRAAGRDHSRVDTRATTRKSTGARYVAALRRRLSGDLDNICLKALRKEPERRYRSVDQLLEDLRRYRKGLPVLARPDTFGYRASKFVGRHRLWLAAAGLLLIGLVGASLYHTSTLTGERDAARLEATKAREISTFLTDLFEQADPSRSRGAQVTARELLALGTRRLEDEATLASQPEAKRYLLQVMGEAHGSLALYDEAERIHTRALAMTRGVYGETHLDVARGEIALGKIALLRDDSDRAEEHLQTALRVCDQLGDAALRERAQAMVELGLVRRYQSNMEEAERLMRAAVALLEDARHGDPGMAVEHATLVNELALQMHESDRFSEAEPLFRRALDLHREISNPTAVADVLFNLGTLLRDLVRDGEAEQCLRDALAIDLEYYGEDHPSVATRISGLAVLLERQRKFDEAREFRERALQIREDVFGEGHTQVAYSLRSIATLERQVLNFERAEELFLQGIAIIESQLGVDSRELHKFLDPLGWLYRDMGDLEKSVAVLRRSVTIRRHPVTLLHLTTSLIKLQRFDEARESKDEALALARRDRPDDHNLIAALTLIGAKIENFAGFPEQGIAIAEEAAEMIARTLGKGNIQRAVALEAAAIARRDLGILGEAITGFDEALWIREAYFPDGHPATARASIRLARTLMQNDEHARAEPLLEAALLYLEGEYDPNHKDVLDARDAIDECVAAAER